MAEKQGEPTKITAFKVRQWLEDWDDLKFDGEQFQAKPKEHFYLFSMPASQLRALSGIYRRSTDGTDNRSDDLSIQRRHDPARSDEIGRFVRGGYPWSELSARKREDSANDTLKKPGWLPTAVVVNILVGGDMREGNTLSDERAIGVEDSDDSTFAELSIPTQLSLSRGELPPIEIIDGQHRLFAFSEDDSAGDDYHLPVVAFHGLDISWQAYLFWTINIKPKKINPSLAFDLYPLLREQSWLEQGESVHVYRESRAQALTEVLWSHPDSPWRNRINMLGGPRKEYGPVTQAAFVRSLTSSMVKSWKRYVGPGGIFGGTPDQNEGLAWSRLQQSAFLLEAWKLLAQKVAATEQEWATSLREEPTGQEPLFEVDGTDIDLAFVGDSTLLATDQGVRGFQYVINDLCWNSSEELGLSGWRDTSESGEVTVEALNQSVESLRKQPVHGFLERICESLATFDWRSSSAPSLRADEKISKSAFRGSGGYKMLREQLTNHLTSSEHSDVAAAASELVGSR